MQIKQFHFFSFLIILIACVVIDADDNSILYTKRKNDANLRLKLIKYNHVINVCVALTRLPIIAI